MRQPLKVWFFVFLLLAASSSYAQQNIIVNLSMLDGTELKQDNIFNFQIINNQGMAREATVKGTLRYRSLPLSLSYTFKTRLQPGQNEFSSATVMSPMWQFSDNALKELFFSHDKLPQGTYEYCVQLQLAQLNPENELEEPVDACIYQTVNDIFLINLVEPENDAKIYEYNPMLSWVVNYPFASELTYKIRVAELKQGQSNENAITRNNPVYQEKNVTATGIVYPVTATPLQAYQPYVWTVDAYYKNILLGGAEVWKFTIIEDTLLKEQLVQQSYYEFQKHNRDTRLNVVAEMKLKYNTNEMTDTLRFVIIDEDNREIKLKQKDATLKMQLGENLVDLPFHETIGLGHRKKYDLRIVSKYNGVFTVPFLYYNPLFLK